MPALPFEAYSVGWICPLPKELAAARAILDEVHEPYSISVPQDSNSYVLGDVCGHNVVIACLPLGVYGTVSAATVANNMRRTFTGIRFGLVIGIGGGIPNLLKGVDVRLGDVVVSHPEGTHGGVVQYDLRKNLGDGKFERKGVLPPPPTPLLTALANILSQPQVHRKHISETLAATIQRSPQLAEGGYVHPGLENDVLYCGNVGDHAAARDNNDSCGHCQSGIVTRVARKDDSPDIHYGVIASGNELVKNAVVRDQLGQEFNAKCIEMEAAGLMADFPCVVIRGICDYADSHKNDVWQEYAAFTAAGFAKELMLIVRPAEVRMVERVLVSGSENVRSRDISPLSDGNFNALLARLDFVDSGSKRAQLSLLEIGTESFRWIKNTAFFSWLQAANSPAFLVVGKPASGKSTLMRYLSDSSKVRDQLCSNNLPWKVVHYFFDFRAGSSPANDPIGMIRLFIRQLAGLSKEMDELICRQTTIQRLETSKVEDCIDVFSDLISRSQLKICAFIDGLDEYQGSLWELCNTLEILRHRTGLKMCVASRPEPEVLKACKDWPSLVMQDHNRQSMLSYVQRRISQEATHKPELEQLFTKWLCETLVCKAEGVILWVKLVLEELLRVCEDQTTTDDLVEIIVSLEPDLGMIYDRILDRIPHRLKHDAALALLLLSEAAPRLENSDRILLQAIEFIQRRNGFDRFLGGNFEMKNMKNRIILFLPNLIEEIPRYRGNEIRLTHLSLAAHLRGTLWLFENLQPALKVEDYGDFWRLLMFEVLTAAKMENALDVSDVCNEWWRIANDIARRQLPKRPLRHDKPCEAPRGTARGIISVQWLRFEDLLGHALVSAPDIFIPNNDFISQEAFGRTREVLNWPCLSSHMSTCWRGCEQALRRAPILERLLHFMHEKKLDVVMAVIHGATLYVENSIETGIVSSGDLEPLLNILLAANYFDILVERRGTKHPTMNLLCEAISSRWKEFAFDKAPSIDDVYNTTCLEARGEAYGSGFWWARRPTVISEHSHNSTRH